MFYSISISEDAIEALLSYWLANGTSARIVRAGQSRCGQHLEWLVHEIERNEDRNASSVVVFTACTTEAGSTKAIHAAMALVEEFEGPVPIVCVGIETVAGFSSCLVRKEMELIHLEDRGSIGRWRWSNDEVGREHASGGRLLKPTEDEREAWSRTRGVLGDSAWERLLGMRVCVVGCGRSGSLALTSLASLGVRHVDVVDPDRVELHNLGEMEQTTLLDLGRYKAESVTEALRSVNRLTSTQIQSVTVSILNSQALPFIKRSDLIFACVDNPQARLAIAVMAALYMKPLVDIGTGVFHLEERRQMGADVRLVLPGRCLFCVGGIAGGEGAARRGLSPNDSATSDDILDTTWSEERAGSVRSLNAIAVQLAMRMIEDLADGRIDRSRWLKLEFDDSGIPRLTNRIPLQPNICVVCAKSAHGDGGVEYIPKMLDAVFQ